MLSSNPSKLYLQSGRTTGCLMCKADIYCITKIALKTSCLTAWTHNCTLLLPFLPKKHTDQGLHGVGWEKGNFLNCVEQLPFFREEDIFSYSIHRKRSHQIKQIYIFLCFCPPGYALREFRMIPILVWGKESFLTHFSLTVGSNC